MITRFRFILLLFPVYGVFSSIQGCAQETTEEAPSSEDDLYGYHYGYRN